MTVAIDASSPAMVNGTGSSSITSGSFTPPAGSLLVAVGFAGWDTDSNLATITISDSRSGTWTNRLLGGSGRGVGKVRIATRPITTSQSMTVTASYTNDGGGRMLAVYVMTGCDTTNVGAGATAQWADAVTTNMTTSITTTKTGSLVVGGVDDSGSSLATLSLASNTAWAPMGGTNPVANSTDSVEHAVIKGSNATGTPGATTFGITASSATFGCMALLEILPPANVNVSANDNANPAADNAGIAATFNGADTGTFSSENATLAVQIAATDTGTGTDAVPKVTVLDSEILSSSEAVRLSTGGGTLAVVGESITAVDSAKILLTGSDTISCPDIKQIAQVGIQGPMPTGPRIYHVGAVT